MPLLCSWPKRSLSPLFRLVALCRRRLSSIYTAYRELFLYNQYIYRLIVRCNPSILNLNLFLALIFILHTSSSQQELQVLEKNNGCKWSNIQRAPAVLLYYYYRAICASWRRIFKWYLSLHFSQGLYFLVRFEGKLFFQPHPFFSFCSPLLNQNSIRNTSKLLANQCAKFESFGTLAEMKDFE